MQQVVVCRCHDPSPAAAQRLLLWASDCAAANIDFTVSLDNTKAWNQTPMERRSRKRKHTMTSDKGCGTAHTLPPAVSPTHRLLRLFAQKKLKVRIHRYTENDLLSHFPALSSMQNYLMNDKKVFEMVSGKCTLGWGFHVEALCLWWNWMKGGKYDYVWVFEDDVGVTQSIATLIRSYENDDSDLITGGAETMPSEWFWKDVFSSNFDTTVGSHKIISKEHVQRFSKALLKRLRVLTMDLGVTAWSEAFTSTVAHNDDNLKMSQFKNENLGDPYKWDGRIQKEEWDTIKRQEEVEEGEEVEKGEEVEEAEDVKFAKVKQPKLYHALKF